MTVYPYSAFLRRHSNELLRSQKLYKPHQIEMAKDIPGLVWIEDRIPPVRPAVPQWAVLRAATFKRDDYTCKYCGSRGGRLECDHIIPVARGGTSDHDNLATACFLCNRSKRDKLLEDWKA